MTGTQEQWNHEDEHMDNMFVGVNWLTFLFSVSIYSDLVQFVI